MKKQQLHALVLAPCIPVIVLRIVINFWHQLRRARVFLVATRHEDDEECSCSAKNYLPAEQISRASKANYGRILAARSDGFPAPDC